jgi:hypothetical protein
MGLSEELGTSASNGKSKNMFHQHGNNGNFRGSPLKPCFLPFSNWNFGFSLWLDKTHMASQATYVAQQGAWPHMGETLPHEFRWAIRHQ